jgi:hypothetical protein
VLVVGGTNGELGVASAEIFNADTGSWTTTGGLNQGRVLHTATMLVDGRVLVAGGTLFQGSNALSSAELYTP